MATVVKIAMADSRPRVPEGFIRTPTAEDILRSVELVRSLDGPALTMIAGAPGVGKTSALHHFCASQGYDALYLSVARGEGKPSDLAAAILAWWGVRANGLRLGVARRMISQYTGRGRVMVVDEAQYLTPEGAEWLRAAAEDGDFDLIYSGDLALANLVSTIPQLQSRMRRPVIIRSVSKNDVEALVAGTGLDSREAIAALVTVARKSGGLRNVENVIRMALLFADRAPVTAQHLKAAIIDMKLGITEGQ